MASYSVAEAKNRLPALINAAERGEAVTITRRGKAVIKLVPIEVPLKMSHPVAIARIRERLAWIPYSEEDSVAQLEAMRSERDF